MIPGTSNCGELGNRKAMDAIFDPSLCSSCQEAIVCFFKRIFWYSMLYQHSFPSSPQMSPLVLSNNADGEARIKIGHVAWELSSIVPITNQETFSNLLKDYVCNCFNQNPQDLPWVSRQDLQPTPIRSRHFHLAWTPDSIRPEDILSVVHLSMKWWHLRGFSYRARLTCWPRR